MPEAAALFMDELANVFGQGHLDSKVEVATVQIPVDTNAECQEYCMLTCTLKWLS